MDNPGEQLFDIATTAAKGKGIRRQFSLCQTFVRDKFTVVTLATLVVPRSNMRSDMNAPEHTFDSLACPPLATLIRDQSQAEMMPAPGSYTRINAVSLPQREQLFDNGIEHLF